MEDSYTTGPDGHIQLNYTKFLDTFSTSFVPNDLPAQPPHTEVNEMSLVTQHASLQQDINAAQVVYKSNTSPPLTVGDTGTTTTTPATATTDANKQESTHPSSPPHSDLHLANPDDLTLTITTPQPARTRSNTHRKASVDINDTTDGEGGVMRGSEIVTPQTERFNLADGGTGAGVSGDEYDYYEGNNKLLHTWNSVLLCRHSLLYVIRSTVLYYSIHV